MTYNVFSGTLNPTLLLLYFYYFGVCAPSVWLQHGCHKLVLFCRFDRFLDTLAGLVLYRSTRYVSRIATTDKHSVSVAVLVRFYIHLH